MPATGNITRLTGQNKGVVRCQCYRCGAALEFDLTAAHQQHQPQHQPPRQQPQPSWQPARPQGLKQQPQPMDALRARSFVMPFGRHKGRTLEQIHRTHPDYVKWLAETMDRSVGRAARGFLELCVQPERN
jgi:hypothetical protein